MGRNDLCIKVPSFFRCPISLDVMKSPVSLSTGVTYDRASIQRWLDGGNNTCPATMQVLQNKDLVPNHTVQRLIQIWSDSVKTRPATAESVINSAVTQSEAKSLIQQLKSIITAETSLYPLSFLSQICSKLILFAKYSEENSTLLSKDTELLRLIFSKFSVFSDNVQLTEKLLQLIYLMLKSYTGENDLIILKGDELVKSLTVNLVSARLDVRLTAMKVLKSLGDIRPELRTLMGENYNIYSGLLSLICQAEVCDQDIEYCLQCLISIAMPKRNRVKLVRAGAVSVLAKALQQESEMNHVLTEKMLKLIELMSTCKEGRIEICGDEKCVMAVLRKVLKVSNVATEHAVTILWSLCCLFSDKKAQEVVGKSNGMAKILLLLQSNVSPAVRQMCTDLLKVFRVSSKTSCLSSYDTKTTHIMPF